MCDGVKEVVITRSAIPAATSAIARRELKVGKWNPEGWDKGPPWRATESSV